MEYTENDIVIRLRMRGKNGVVDAKNLLQSLDSIEEALYESDRKDIELLHEAGLITRLVADAALERLRRYRHNRLLLRNAENGSIILDGVVAAVPLYILKITLGEAIEKAVQESEAFNNLKEWFKDHIDQKSDYVLNALRNALNSKSRSFELKSDKNRIELITRESGNERDNPQIKSLGEELNK